MTRTLFGTDGIRGRVNTHPMTAEICLALGRAVAGWARQAGRGSRVLVGRDTRLSGPMLEGALNAGLASAGATPVSLGVVPTPAVALLVRELGASAGLVVSASHNPYVDNGVKVFGPDGFKLSDDAEQALEARCLDDAARAELVDAESVATPELVANAGARYLAALRAGVPDDFSLEGLRLLVDCAHGATATLATPLFEGLGATVVPIGVAPNGRNINDGVGATATGRAEQLVAAREADVGVCFDGDGDRLILIDETGTPVDGDQVLTLGALAMQAAGTLTGDGVVATVMSNLGLEHALRPHGLQVVRCGVGDRYVVETMRQRGFNFGGEQSGHIVNLRQGTTGDGLATALLVLSEMHRQQQPLSALRRQMTRLPQVLINVAVRAKPPLNTLSETGAAVADAEGELAENGRVLLRYSGTEQKARVMVEGLDSDRVLQLAERIAAAVKADIGAAE